MAINHNTTRNSMIASHYVDTTLHVTHALRFIALAMPPKGGHLSEEEEMGRYFLLLCCIDALESFTD